MGEGRVALVSGGNRGIGLEVCRQLVEAGHRVLLGSRDVTRGEAAAEGMPKGSLRVVALDVAGEALEAQVAAAAEVFGPVEILVNNAAVHYDSFQTASGADMAIVQEALQINLVGAWRLAQAVIPGMRAAGWGRLVNVSSGAGALGSIGASTPAYSVSKAGLNALTLSLAADLRADGVLVNAVCPGWVATDMGGAGGRPVPDGARGVVWAATLPDDGPTGGFFRDGARIAW